MINSNWTDPCHHVKQDPAKARKKDAKHDEQDVTDMIFIGPDADVISLTKSGKIRELIIQLLCNILKSTRRNISNDDKLICY